MQRNMFLAGALAATWIGAALVAPQTAQADDYDAVSEVRKAIGELKVGTHRTEYRWNGTDEYGDRLANGVYLYRIAANDSAGKPYKSYSELEDQGIGRYFANGLMRGSGRF